MRRIIGITALFVAIAVVVSAGQASAASDGKRHAKTFKLWAETVQDEFLDLGGPGPSLGDRIVFSDDLSRKRGGRVVGYNAGECAIVRIDQEFYDFTTQCVVTVSLARGQITVQGLLSFTNVEPQERATLAVTGGTGRYRGASGQVTVRFISDTESRLTFRLR